MNEILKILWTFSAPEIPRHCKIFSPGLTNEEAKESFTQFPEPPLVPQTRLNIFEFLVFWLKGLFFPLSYFCRAFLSVPAII